MRRLTPPILFVILILLSACGSKPSATATDFDAKFRQVIGSGITLVGRSSSVKSDRISSEERYTISSASKLGGDTWLLTAKFKYDGKELPIPVPASIRWAGDDTPVICMTDVGVPGMGSYTARVVLYGDQYAGTWSGKDGVGGQLFGRIVRGTQ